MGPPTPTYSTFSNFLLISIINWLAIKSPEASPATIAILVIYLTMPRLELSIKSK